MFNIYIKVRQKDARVRNDEKEIEKNEREFVYIGNILYQLLNNFKLFRKMPYMTFTIAFVLYV